MSGAFYLIWQCNMRNAIRTFAMDRIQNYTITDESFEIPEDFSLEDYLQTAFRVMRGKPEKVTFRLTQGAAHVVRERIWHPTQELREIELAFRAIRCIRGAIFRSKSLDVPY